jgi:hypothetical protein
MTRCARLSTHNIIGGSLMKKLFVLLAVFLFASVATAAEVALPFYNDFGYSTTFVYINNTDAPVAIDEAPVVISPQPPAKTIAARSAYRSANVNAGLGVAIVNVPDGVEALSEIRTPHGAIIPIEPLVAMETARFYNIKPLDGFNSAVIIVAATDTAISIDGGGAFKLSAGESAAIATSNDTLKVSNKWNISPAPPSGKFYAFGYVNHATTGSLFAVKAR